jgi:hypothetical protein
MDCKWEVCDLQIVTNMLLDHIMDEEELQVRIFFCRVCICCKDIHV